MTFAMSFEDRAAGVAALGFTPRQARFLTAVMLHSGVCLPRHYTKFAGIAFGHNTRDFFAKLTREKLATAYACWRRQGTYFHVHHKALYRAIGEPDNRHRRRPTIPRTAERLMLLDIVFDHPEMTWLGAEADKVFNFSQRHNVPREELPSLVFEQSGSRTVRYFPDKLPIGVDERGRVLFVYLVTDPNPDAVRRFMHRHRPLFSRVPQWTLGLFFPGYLAGAETRIRAAVMESFAAPLTLSTLDEFKWFCGARREAERGVPPIDELRYSRARQRFGAPRFHAAYRAWLNDGGTGFYELMSTGLRDRLECGAARIEAHVLAHRYLNIASAAMTA
jgi:hypothetical protein